jgi:hypothetical protein
MHDWGDDLDVCSSCEDAMRTAHLTAKRKVWDELPTVFGLPDWTTLMKMKDDAIAD